MTAWKPNKLHNGLLVSVIRIDYKMINTSTSSFHERSTKHTHSVQKKTGVTYCEYIKYKLNGKVRYSKQLGLTIYFHGNVSNFDRVYFIVCVPKAKTALKNISPPKP
jgi:hypothetical protein